MENKSKVLNKRQENILEILKKRKEFGISEIWLELKIIFKSLSKITVNRDLRKLIEFGYITAKGKARAVTYELSLHYNLVCPINIEKYFKIDPDKRESKKRFDFNVFSLLKNILTEEEVRYLSGLNNKYRKNLEKISQTIKKKELERLTIELSWKSSKIEGNTYTLLETEVLIMEGKAAKGHKREETIMILNHKETLDYIVKNKSIFKKITTSKVEDIHYLLTKNLGIARNLRKTSVGIVGTKYMPLDNQHQIREAIEKACDAVNAENNVFVKAIILSILIAHIQPFEDGNKRTSRLIANAILFAYNICPLSYRKVDEVEYKKAVILFYEQNNLSYFKELFIEQFEFAVNNYFKA
ncbi:MAG: Fic family protein [bacterium]